LGVGLRDSRGETDEPTKVKEGIGGGGAALPKKTAERKSSDFIPPLSRRAIKAKGF